MTWTYSGNPGASLRDRVRYLLGDTTQTAQSLTDGEIDWELSQYEQDPVRAAIAAAEATATRFAGLSASMKRVGDLQIANDHAGTAQRFRDLARRISVRYAPLAVPLMRDDRASVFAVGADDNRSYYADDTARRYL